MGTDGNAATDIVRLSKMANLGSAAMRADDCKERLKMPDETGTFCILHGLLLKLSNEIKDNDSGSFMSSMAVLGMAGIVQQCIDDLNKSKVSQKPEATT